MNANSTGNWFVSDAGTGPWKRINGSCISQSKLRGGDFNGDGKTDVFNARGGSWFVSFGGKTKWKRINGSKIHIDQLRFGDFNGDGKTDVFNTRGGEWFVSFGGNTKWKRINASNFPVTRFRFGDFNGDGKTDVFVKWDGKWRMSSGASKSWKIINATNPGVPDLGKRDLLSGNYIGDSRKDKFKSDRSGCSSTGGGKPEPKPPINCGGHNQFACGYPKCGLNGNNCTCDAGLNKVNNKCYSCGTIEQYCCTGSGAYTKCFEGYCKSPGNTCQQNP